MDLAAVRHQVGPMTYRWRLEASSAWNNAWCIDGTRDVPTALLLAMARAVTDPAPVQRPDWARYFPGITVVRPSASPSSPELPTTTPPRAAVPKPRGR